MAPLLIRSFMMRLGFQQNKDSFKKFTGSMKETSLQAQSAQRSLDGLKERAEKVVAPIQRLAQEMNALFYSTRLADTTAGKMRGISYAAEKAGIAGDLVEKMSISLASWRENNPGMIALIEGLTGIQTKGRAATDVVKELLTSISNMNPLVGSQLAEQLGVDYETVRLWREFRGEIEKSDQAAQAMYKSLGVDLEAAKVAGREYTNMQRDIGLRWDALKEKATIAFLPSAKTLTSGVKGALEWMTSKGITTTNQDAANRTNTAAQETARIQGMDSYRGSANIPQTKAQYLGQLERERGLPSGSLDSIWAIESRRGQNKGRGVSSTGRRTTAEGDFQFTDDTAKQYGLKNKQDCTESAKAAASYLKDLLKEFNGDLRSAVTAYHEGAKTIKEYGPTSKMLTPDGQVYFEKFKQHQDQARLGRDPGQANGDQILHQTNNTQITVSGANNPREVAKEVGSQWNSTVRNNTSMYFPRG